MVNHLIQSTVFAVMAGLLTLFLRNNHARTRYWIWLTASLKFLVPFSLFVEIGHRLSWSSAPVITQPRLIVVMDELSQPFTAPGFAVPSLPVSSTASIMPSALLAVWIIGCAVVLVFWCVRWRRVAAVLQTGSLLRHGREIRALRRTGSEIALISSPSQIEPGVFGILRPVLSLPAGIGDHLDDFQLDAILAHELSHVRRRDNLTAALHMLVEAVFWFHPLVWWIGARLVEERERACDEDVVRLGSDPEIYAGTILQICKICLASPLACASGIGGGNLSGRIESIMKNPLLHSLSFGKKIVLVSIGALALIAPITVGLIGMPVVRAQTQARGATDPSFEVASVKENLSGSRDGSWGCRGIDGKTQGDISGGNLHLVSSEDVPLGRCVARNIALKWIVSWAYQISWDQMNQAIVGGPEWFSAGIGSSERFDIDAKAGQPATRAQLYQMLQTLLANRFGLKVHEENREQEVYQLTIAKNPTKLTKSPEDRDCSIVAAGEVPCHSFLGGFGIGLTGRSVSMQDLATRLSRYTGLLVVDKTGLDGLYDIKTSDFWMPFPDEPDRSPVPTMFDMLQDQLGLKLKTGKEPVKVLAIDHAEKPSAN